MKNVKKSFSDRKFKMGGFQTLIMVIVIVVVVILNLLVGKMNISVDLSSDKVYTLTDDTKKLAEKLTEPIKIYYMCQSGNENSTIKKVVDQYNGLKNISVETKDPVIYPNFSKTYTEEEIADNDVIIADTKNNKSKHVSASDMLIQDMDYSSYSQTNTLDAEGQITAAIQSVTSKDSIKMYMTSGHGEQSAGTALTDILSKSNVTTSTLATASAAEIPDDCNILLINGPQYDFSEAEYKIISNYLNNGGKAIFFLNAQSEKHDNYDKLLSDFGINAVNGCVFDSKQSLNEQMPTVLNPTVETHDITADVKDSTPVFLQTGIGMTTQKNVRSTLTVEPLLKTSEDAFSRTDYNEASTEKIEGDISGPFTVAAAITDKYSENTKGTGYATKIAVFGTYHFADDALISDNQYGNRSMLLNSFTWLVGKQTSTLAIPTRSLDTQTVTIDDGDRIFWTVALVVVLPFAFLLIGFIIWMRRRKR